MQEEQLIRDLAITYELPVLKDQGELNRQWLAEKINELLNNDFSRLVSILYRVDVSESKLRSLLEQHPGTDAGLLIADLLIQRQLEKQRSKEQFRSKDQPIDDNEKW